MMKIKIIFFFFGISLFESSLLQAQDIEKEFEEFTRQQQQTFEDFKNKADAEFETFLREAWQKYDAFAPVPAPQRPEPPEPVIFDPAKTQSDPIIVRPGATKTPDAPVPDAVMPSGETYLSNPR